MPQAVDNFLRLRPSLRDVREQEDGWILALFDYEMKDMDRLSLLTELHNGGVIAEFRRGGHLVFPPKLGDSGPLELRIDTGKLPGYFETYDSLIRSNPDIPPQELTVWKKGDAFHAGYTAACALLQFLKSKAEVWDTTGQRFFLVDQQAVEIPLTSYLSQQTTNLPSHLPAITRFLNSEHLDADARWAFFRKASLRLLRDFPKEKRLGVLMENLGNVFDRAQQDHSLYLERFSFEDLLKNFDEKRLKFVGDLNQILASIQTALIAVPIGFFLIAEKFKPTNGWIGQNIVLAAGGLVFFALVLVLSLNQGKTLKGVKLALTDFETEQKRKVTDKSERLQNLLASTWSQYGRVRCLLWVVRFLLLLFSVIIVAALLWCSIPAWQKFLPYAVKDSTPPPTTNAVATPKTP
ncbi:MAG TPA: hypothetical protein PKI20_05565 [Verrucomicrobiota bacterium]|jgi:hypothetical protein|nr:hypothetical protein [Verrucomicrobiota bacterium]HQL77353.1 hypothetical protein [Verrucomicrobiota bacterium]